MKRLFQRHGSSTPERSPSNPAAAHTPEKKAQGVDALPESASQLVVSPRSGPAIPVAAGPAIADLHQRVIAFVVSQTKSAQIDALKAIRSRSVMDMHRYCPEWPGFDDEMVDTQLTSKVSNLVWRKFASSLRGLYYLTTILLTGSF